MGCKLRKLLASAGIRILRQRSKRAAVDEGPRRHLDFVLQLFSAGKWIFDVVAQRERSHVHVDESAIADHATGKIADLNTDHMPSEP